MTQIVCNALTLYSIAIIGRIVLDYIQVPSDHPVGRVRSFLAAIIDPLLFPLRRMLPSIPAGSIRLDLSPLVLILAVNIAAGIIC